MNTSRLLYSRREAAQLLSLSLRTIDHLISEHKLQIRKTGKRVLVLADSLAKYAGAAGEKQSSRRMPALGDESRANPDGFQKPSF